LKVFSALGSLGETPRYPYRLIELVNGAVMVFVANLIGNTMNFQGRFVNALTTAIVFAVAFSGQ
jgi:hypothetical protein